MEPKYGWICPRCATVFSPDVRQCNCCIQGKAKGVSRPPKEEIVESETEGEAVLGLKKPYRG